MPDHFSIRETIPCTAIAGNIVTATSDIPAHLWMRWTTIPPRIHKKPVLRRGMWLNDDVRFCFDAYQDIEQDQPGDTLTHTFTMEPCLQGRRWWYYIWGYVAEVLSPSTSPILYYDCDDPCPEPPEPLRFAWSRRFSVGGTFRYLDPGEGHAAIFRAPSIPTAMTHARLYTRTNAPGTMLAYLYAVDAQYRPTGFHLANAIIDQTEGLKIQDGDGWRTVYQHTAALPWNLTPDTPYAIVSIGTAGRPHTYLRFDSVSWEGDKDEGMQANLTLKWTDDYGATWVPAYPYYQCYEAWGTQ